ncbi:MAG: hypothetical protein AB7L90_12325 [Hyphomicrobiaceae bacterium]
MAYDADRDASAHLWRTSANRRFASVGTSGAGVVLAVGVLVLLGLMFFLGAVSDREEPGVGGQPQPAPVTAVPRPPSSPAPASNLSR